MRAPPHPPLPRPSPTYPIAALVIADLFQMSGYDIARLYETFRERRFQASTFQTFLGGWSEDGVPKISPMARTLGDSRSILLYIYLFQKPGKGPALNYQNVIGQLEVFLCHPNCHTKRQPKIKIQIENCMICKRELWMTFFQTGAKC